MHSRVLLASYTATMPASQHRLQVQPRTRLGQHRPLGQCRTECRARRVQQGGSEGSLLRAAEIGRPHQLPNGGRSLNPHLIQPPPQPHTRLHQEPSHPARHQLAGSVAPARQMQIQGHHHVTRKAHGAGVPHLRLLSQAPRASSTTCI